VGQFIQIVVLYCSRFLLFVAFGAGGYGGCLGVMANIGAQDPADC